MGILLDTKVIEINAQMIRHTEEAQNWLEQKNTSLWSKVKLPPYLSA